MRYAIAINMDYENQPYQTVRHVFDELKTAMVQAGFRQDGRVFTVELSASEACELARQVVAQVESHHVGANPTYRYIREFYGFDYSTVENLLLPPSEEISVEEIGEIENVEIIRF